MSNKKEKAAETVAAEGGTLAPKLRFPEFRNTGEWLKRKLGSLGSFTGGGTPDKNNFSYWEGMNPWVSSSDISDDSIYEIKISRFISDQAIQETSTKIVPENSILLVSRVGVGKIAITRNKICTSQDFTNFTPDEANLVFLAYSLKTMRDKFLSFNQGMAIKGFTKNDVSSLEVPLPVEPREQQKIADCLTTIDELINLESQKLDTLKRHKKGLMQQLFPAEGETVPRLRFPEFRDAGEWTECALGLLTTKIGSGITPIGGDKNYKTEGCPFVRSQNIGWGELILDDVAFIDEKTHQSFDSTEIKMFDVLLNITGASIGRSAVADSRIAGGNVNQHVCIIRVRQDKLSPALLNQFLISEHGQRQIDSFQAGGNRQGLNFAQIRSFAVPLPPTEIEQGRIADHLSSLDELITTQTKKIESLKNHKKGLMQQLFPAPDGFSAAQAGNT